MVTLLKDSFVESDVIIGEVSSVSLELVEVEVKVSMVVTANVVASEDEGVEVVSSESIVFNVVSSEGVVVDVIVSDRVLVDIVSSEGVTDDVVASVFVVDNVELIPDNVIQNIG